MHTYFEHGPRRRNDSDIGPWLLALVAFLIFWGKMLVVAQQLHP